MNLTMILVVAATLSAAWVLLQGAEQIVTEHAVFGTGITQPSELKPMQTEEEIQALANKIKDRQKAFIRTVYVCGDELEPIGQMDAAEMLAYHKSNPYTVASLAADGSIHFVKTIEDLSPHCKENAYFGMDKGGNLSLFEGVPGTGEGNVIQTFFQLNIEHLESSLPRDAIKELYRGIQVRDLSEYNSVLSTFSDFAVEVTEKAMQLSR
ncbi:BofC C-terminal domain-containing protein [Paenibacillus agricola]|nr:BofC C-terminal domain-containing protein [Paenibacillus agricola]